MDEDLKYPVVNPDIIEYLESTFRVDSLLSAQVHPNDRIGYIKGVRAVINNLTNLQPFVSNEVYRKTRK